MSNPPSPLPPAGWYPDPAGSGGVRYWTGQAWTRETRPYVAPPARPVQQPYQASRTHADGATVGAPASGRAVLLGHPHTASAAPAPMGFGDAVATCLRKYADFTGVATRAEYRWFRLFVLLVEIAFAVIGSVLLGDFFLVIVIVPVLALLLPTYAVIVRRLRDAGHEWWWVLLAVFPFVWIVLFKFLSDPSRPAWQDDGYSLGPVGGVSR